MVTEVKLQQLMENGIRPLKKVARWRAAIGDMLPFLGLDEMVSSTNFHERGFMIPMSDFFHSFFCEYGFQL